MPQLAVTVLGHDRPGIIAAVTGALAGLGGNLEDSSMTRLRGHFAMTLIVAGSGTAAEVEAALAPAVPDLLVSVREVPEESEPQAVGSPYLLTVHGADRPGIVSAVTSVLADAGGNVTDLTTRLAGRLYLLVVEVELPAVLRRRGPHRAARRHRPRAGRRGVAAPGGGRRPVTGPLLAVDLPAGRVLPVVAAPDPVLSTPVRRRRPARPGRRAAGRRPARHPARLARAASAWPPTRWASAGGCSRWTCRPTPRRAPTTARTCW